MMMCAVSNSSWLYVVLLLPFSMLVSVYVCDPENYIKLICSKLDASYLVHIIINVMIVPYDIALLFMLIKHHICC